ncbi:MAG TPA: L-lactate dehydrogenase [Tepidisphaeraceae bacterium]|jgi:L-lactate dehydrogenase
MNQQTTRKVAIVGAGSVGATIAYACLIRGVAQRVALYDVNRAKAHAEALDLNHGAQFFPQAMVEGSDDVEVCRDADVMVVTAGAKQKPGQSRMDLAQANAAICKEMVPKLIAVAPQSILLLVTNPVDVITYITHKISSFPRERVFGSGTVLDSSRFRMLIARRCNVAVGNVHAYIAGEHGESEIPLWSSASIGAIPLKDWAVPGHGKLTVRDRTEIFQNVKDAAQQIIAGKGATNFAIGLATARILESVLRDENRILPVSSLLTDYQGMGDVCFSVPCIVNGKGVEQALKIPLNQNEQAGLANSAETIRGAIRELGF